MRVNNLLLGDITSYQTLCILNAKEHCPSFLILESRFYEPIR